MKSTNLILFSTASVVRCLQTGDFFPLPVEEDETATDAQASTQDDYTPVQDCYLECQNSGTCVFDLLGISSCSCPSGFSGELCQDEGEPCGTNYCHYGGKCFEIQLANGSFEHMCDCTHAFTESNYYAGEFCQYPSTAFCTGKDDLNGRQFCVNGGQCPRERHLPCICPEGYLGPRCAFQVGVDGLDYTECGLHCENGGTCQKGLKDSKYSENIGLFLTAAEQKQHVNYEHCVCPTGYYGIRCEYEAAVCGNGQHLCLHGSICSKNNDSEFGCDCTSTQLKTAGLYCEHIASTDCDTIGNMDTGYRGFCTNGGKCDLDSDGFPLCSCPEGFTGLHCEFHMSSDVVNPYEVSSNDEGGLGVFGLIGVVISAVVAAMGIAAILHYHQNKKTENKYLETEDSSAPSLDHNTWKSVVAGSGVRTVEVL